MSYYNIICKLGIFNLFMEVLEKITCWYSDNELNSFTNIKHVGAMHCIFVKWVSSIKNVLFLQPAPCALCLCQCSHIVVPSKSYIL